MRWLLPSLTFKAMTSLARSQAALARVCLGLELAHAQTVEDALALR
jgi:hypothetical protein